ncbi:MAG: VOC family protein [Nocardioidaceae bacterium]|nr:VOC family protein [Nocardioidaceae bacterium]
MSDSQLSVSAVLAALPSSDLGRSEAFYTALLGKPVDDRPMPVLAQWRWGDFVLQVVEDAGRAGGGLLTLLVPDMAAAVAGIRDRRLPASFDAGTVVAQVAVLTDPDGNQITLVEAR